MGKLMCLLGVGKLCLLSLDEYIVIAILVVAIVVAAFILVSAQPPPPRCRTVYCVRL